jgi:hypothetical protein
VRGKWKNTKESRTSKEKDKHKRSKK